MKVKITKVSATNTNQQGDELISQKSGKPYWKVGIQTQEYGATWINGFTNYEPKDWEGKEMELEIEDKVYNGKTYKNFRMIPKGAAGQEQVLNVLKMHETLLREILAGVKQINDPSY